MIVVCCALEGLAVPKVITVILCTAPLVKFAAHSCARQYGAQLVEFLMIVPPVLSDAPLTSSIY